MLFSQMNPCTFCKACQAYELGMLLSILISDGGSHSIKKQVSANAGFIEEHEFSGSESGAEDAEPPSEGGTSDMASEPDLGSDNDELLEDEELEEDLRPEAELAKAAGKLMASANRMYTGIEQQCCLSPGRLQLVLAYINCSPFHPLDLPKRYNRIYCSSIILHLTKSCSMTKFKKELNLHYVGN